MSHSYANDRAARAGQYALDNAAPDEDGPTECDECSGTGEVSDPDDDESTIKCDNCDGLGGIDCDGNPCELE